MAAAMRRIGVGLAALATMAGLAPPVAAHSMVGRMEAPLPLVVYLFGAGLAVALSFVFVLLRDVRPTPARATETATVPRWLTLVLRGTGLGAWSPPQGAATARRGDAYPLPALATELETCASQSLESSGATRKTDERTTEHQMEITTRAPFQCCALRGEGSTQGDQPQVGKAHSGFDFSAR